MVITGAAGRIGRAVTESLTERWEIVATDLPGRGVLDLDVTDERRCKAVFARADAVVHLAAVPDPLAGWDELLPANIVGAYAVATAAVDMHVRRLVLASSLQAVSAYPPDRQVRTADAPRPANLYGATKAWAEALGSWVVTSSHVEVVVLRIGYYAERPPRGADVGVSGRAAWISPADCARLVLAAVEGEVQGFTVVNGVSANRYRKADYGEAERRLGYEPRDDAWRCHG